MSAVYDTMVPPLRAIVDRLVIETGDQGWDVRRAYLASVRTAFERSGAPLDTDTELSEVIAGLVERLGEPPIDGRLQAGIYAASAKPEHREASEDWFARHPDQYRTILEELTHGPRLN